jgi:excisionase family DNA binding protein
MDHEWLGLSDAAKILGVHPSTVRSWADHGMLPVHRTSGGHRRFRREDVELWMQAQDPGAGIELELLVKNALKRTRLQISEGRITHESWYQKLDEESREQYRLSGRSLLQGLLNYLSSKEISPDAEARSLGYEYASRGRHCGLSSVEAVDAFLFFRNMLLESILSYYETAGIRSPKAWGDMLRRIHSFTDQIMITLIESYDAYQAGAR